MSVNISFHIFTDIYNIYVHGNQQSHIGFKSEKAGDYTYSLDNGSGSSIPSLAMRILNKHRRLFARGAT